MKYLVFLLMFVPLSALVGAALALVFWSWSVGLVGAALALVFWSWSVGLVGAGFMLGLSADVCFNGSGRDE